MVLYIKKEKDSIVIYRTEGREIIKFKDWFYLKDLDYLKNNFLKEKLENDFLDSLKDFISEKEKKKLFNKEYFFQKFVFPLSQREKVNKLIKKIKENLEKEEKEEFKNLIYEFDISLETKIFLNNLKALDEDEIKKIKKVAFDLEIWNDNFPNPNTDPIVLASFYGDDIKKVLVLKDKKLDFRKINEVNKEKGFDYEIEVVENEKELIKKIIGILDNYNLIFSYNGDNFDFYFLKERAKRFDLPKELVEKIEVKGVKDKKSTIKGKTHIDLFVFIKNIMAVTLKSELLNLDQVSKEVLGEGKEGSWKVIKDINYLIPYNFKDSYLTYKLGLYYLPILIQLSKVVNQPLFKTSRATYGKLVEYKLMKEANKFNQIIPLQPDFKEIKRRDSLSYEGAFVYEPKFGVYENIVVLDFQSLYPSIIATFNICPTTYDGFIELNKEEYEELKQKLEIKDLENETHYITPPIKLFNKYFRFKFKKERGFIPEIIKKLFNERVKIKKEYKKLKKWFEENKSKLNDQEKIETEEKIKFLYAEQYSLKILINSMYGYLGYSRARWFSIESAMSITAFGRYFIKKIIKLAEEKGFKVIYGDTDSLFIVYSSKEKLLDFLDYVNEKVLPGLMKLDLENFYKRGIFVPLKGGEGGAKKKYALISESGEIKIRGFETVRRDWAILTKEVQNKVIELVLKGKEKEALNYVLEVIEKLKKHEIDKEKLVIYTQLRKDLEEYESEGPHVKIAKKLEKLGLKVKKGLIISYIVGKGKGNIGDRVFLPNEDVEYDENYYINNQIIPAVERIFEVVGLDLKSKVYKRGKQISLTSFLTKEKI